MVEEEEEEEKVAVVEGRQELEEVAMGSQSCPSARQSSLSTRNQTNEIEE